MSRVLKTGANQVTQKYSQHKGWAKGIDIVKSPNLTDVIVAHSAGTVIKVMTGQVNGKNDSEGFGYGNYVMIKHEDNFVTLYAHLKEVYVKAGQIVSKGQEIGYMGDTGNSYGAHLHFEIRKYSSYTNNVHDTKTFKWLDPVEYLDENLPAAVVLNRVQTGAFSNKTYAIALARELIKKGYNAIIKFYNGMYHVQVGAFAVKASAEKLAAELNERGYATYITTETGTDIAFT